MKQKTRSVLHHSLVVDSTERGHRYCSGEFEQLLLTCIEGCGLRSNTNRMRKSIFRVSSHTQHIEFEFSWISSDPRNVECQNFLTSHMQKNNYMYDCM